jgi:uncharacterized protein (TIGR00266 family)
MKYEIVGKPSYSLVKLELEEGERITAEAGAMVSMSSNISMETKARGGIFSSLKRSMLGGESFFMNTFYADGGIGEILLAPMMVGDVHAIELTGETVYLRSGSYLASFGNIDIDTKWGGAKTFFGGEGLFLLKISGSGTLFFSSYGAIVEKFIDGNYIIDTSHIVAFDETLNFKVKKAGNWKSFFFSGEGLVCEFTGNGKVFIQTRNLDAFVGWMKSKVKGRGD